MPSLTNPNAQWQQTVAPEPQIPEAISTANLGDTPALTIPPAPQPTNAASMTNGYLEALAAQSSQLDQQEQQTQSTGTSLFDEIMGRTAGPTPTEQKMQLEEQSGLNTKRKEYNAALGKLKALQAESMVLPSVIQEESQGRGVTKAGVAPIEAGRQRQLQIEQMRAAAYASALSDDINLAQSAISDLLKIEFEKREQDNERLKLAYQKNRDSLERIDKKKADNMQLMIKERDRLFEQDRMQREAMYQVGYEAARNGASQSEVDAITNATSREDAMARAASYLSAPFRAEQEQRDFQNKIALRSMAIQEAQLRLAQDKTRIENEQRALDIENGVLDEKELRDVDNSPQGKKVKSLGDLGLKLSAYQQLVKEYGTSSFGAEKSKLDAAYADLKIAYKTAAELGAIQAPDVPIIEGALRSATFSNPLSQAFYKVTGSGTLSSINAGLDQAASLIQASGELNIQQLMQRNPKYSNSGYVQALVLPLMSTRTTVNIGGQDVKIGSIITNERGDRGRIEADGTITPL